MTDHAMRAARDRWLADPESAGTGKAFEAGWSARDEEVSRECARRAAAEGRVRELETALQGLGNTVAQYLCDNIRGKDAYSALDEGAHRAFQLVPVDDDPPTPTGEATTGEDC